MNSWAKTWSAYKQCSEQQILRVRVTQWLSDSFVQHIKKMFDVEVIRSTTDDSYGIDGFNYYVTIFPVTDRSVVLIQIVLSEYLYE